VGEFKREHARRESLGCERALILVVTVSSFSPPYAISELIAVKRLDNSARAEPRPNDNCVRDLAIRRGRWRKVLAAVSLARVCHACGGIRVAACGSQCNCNCRVTARSSLRQRVDLCFVPSSLRSDERSEPERSSRQLAIAIAGMQEDRQAGEGKQRGVRRDKSIQRDLPRDPARTGKLPRRRATSVVSSIARGVLRRETARRPMRAIPFGVSAGSRGHKRGANCQ